MRTIAPDTYRNGRDSELRAVSVIVVATEHAAAPRGSLQKRMVLGSSPLFQAMYAVPAPSSATLGSEPVPIVVAVAAPAAAGTARSTITARTTDSRRIMTSLS